MVLRNLLDLFSSTDSGEIMSLCLDVCAGVLKSIQAGAATLN